MTSQFKLIQRIKVHRLSSFSWRLLHSFSQVQAAVQESPTRRHDTMHRLSSVGGSLLLSRFFLVKSLYLRWFKFEASPYRRPMNLKQTVKVSSLMTVQSVPRFFSPTRSSLCFFSVVNPQFLPMPFRLLVELHPVKACRPVKDCTRLAPLF